MDTVCNSLLLRVARTAILENSKSFVLRFTSHSQSGTPTGNQWPKERRKIGKKKRLKILNVVSDWLLLVNDYYVTMNKRGKRSNPFGKFPNPCAIEIEENSIS